MRNPTTNDARPKMHATNAGTDVLEAQLGRAFCTSAVCVADRSVQLAVPHV